MADIYEQHTKAFPDASAFLVLKDGEAVARVAFKTTGRRNPNGLTVWCYLHVLGLPMVRGKTGPGGGYAMKDAAFHLAAQKVKARDGLELANTAKAANAVCRSYADNGAHWAGWLRSHGYQVEQAL